MAKSSVLDEAIAASGPPTYARVKGGGKVDRLLNSLSDVGFDEHERLLDMMAEPVSVYDNPYMLGILATICGEYGIGTNDVTTANLSQWRSRLRAER